MSVKEQYVTDDSSKTLYFIKIDFKSILTFISFNTFLLLKGLEFYRHTIVISYFI